MNTPTLLALALLGSVAINAIHWRGRKDERFLYHPQAGWLRVLFTVWMMATVIAAVLRLGGYIASAAFIGVALGFTITHELYSVIRRQRQRNHKTATAL